MQNRSFIFPTLLLVALGAASPLRAQVSPAPAPAAAQAQAPDKAPQPPQAPARKTVAVLPLRALGVRVDAARALEETLRAEVATLPEVRLASPAQVSRGLSREPDCDARVSCAAGAAAAAGAATLLMGTVSELGDTYMLDLKLLDAGTARELRRASHPVSGDKNGLIEVVRAAAVELLAPARYAGSLLVRLAGPSQAEGAELFVDGKPVGRAPMSEPIGGLPPGQHTLRVSRAGLADVSVFVDIRFDRVTEAEVDVARGALTRQGYANDAAALAASSEAGFAPGPASAGLAAPGSAAAGEGPGGSLSPGSSSSADRQILVLATAPAQRSPVLRVAGWSALGVGVVAAVVGVTFHARAYSTASDLNRREQQNQLTTSDVQSYADVRSEVNSARVLYGVGAFFAVSGAALLVYDQLAAQAQAQQRTSWAPLPVSPARGAGLALTQRF